MIKTVIVEDDLMVGFYQFPVCKTKSKYSDRCYLS